uniref:Uncharacterized protein n=1 Tax=Geoglobus ahangari TaxID=113653 RepID=A0A7J3TJ85_9EURY
MLFWRKKKVETKETPVEEKGEEVEILESYKIDDLVSVRIVAGTPPRYEVIEPELTAGERELIKEIKTRLYEVIDAEPDEIADRESYLRGTVFRK